MITISISDGTYTAARTGEPEDTASSVLARVLEDLAKLRADDEGIEHAAESLYREYCGAAGVNSGLPRWAMDREFWRNLARRLP